MSEEITSELHKLEITSPVATQLGDINFTDMNLPLNLNPFYENVTTQKDLKCKDGKPAPNSKQMPRNQLGCSRCRLRRRSESVADAYKSATSTLNTEYLDTSCWTHSTLGIQRQTLKHRRNILRPPVLRRLQNLQKLLQELPLKKKDPTRTSLSGSKLSLTRSNLITSSQNRGICDFRDLIHECQNLLEMENDVKGRFGLVSPDQRISKTFTTMQLSKPSRSLFSNKDEIGCKVVSTTHQSSPERNTGMGSRSPPASTSCSQQAGNSASVVSNSSGGGDDVTIDELASYFDTFVHIPKKMSTMAEMMYI